MKLGGQSYDEWFAAGSPVNRVQFWGLVVVGGSLIIVGFALLATVLSKFPPQSLDTLEVIVLLLPLGICSAIIYFGVLHIKRAFVGGHTR